MIEPDLVLHFTDKVTIPDACKNCPTLADLGRLHDSLTRRASHLANFVVSGRVDAEFDQFMQRQNMPQDEAESAAEGYKSGLRQVTSSMVDGMYDDADKTVHLAEEALGACPAEGTLTLRARRAGRQITATFCMSQKMEQVTEASGINTESVVVRRTTIEE